MVVKIVVRPIAKLIKWHARVQAAHCFGIAGARRTRLRFAWGRERPAPAAALKMQCGDQARAGIRDPWERYKIIQNQRGQSVKIGTITVSKRSRPPAHSSKPRKLLQGVGALTHAGDFAASGVSMYLGRPLRDQLRHFGICPNSGSRSTTDSPTNQGLTAREVSVWCPRNHTRRCRYACR
jgi:hypothetical protein